MQTDRRNATERRRGSDRRRGVESRRVVMHLGRSQLRVGLAVGNGDVLHSSTIDWRGDSQPLPAPEAFEALRQQLKQFVVHERLAGCPASLVLNGELCVTRVKSGPNAEVEQALDGTDERSQLYLLLGVGAKTIATSRAPLDARHERAVVSVASEAIVQQLIEVITAAGLELEFIEAETVALARAHAALHKADDQPVLLVQFDDDGFEIAVAHGGSLLLDYRPGRAGDMDVWTVLDHHHARLERFCQRQIRDYGLKLQKVYLAGRPDRVHAATRSLPAGSPYDAKAIDTPAAKSMWTRLSRDLDSGDAAMLGRLLRDIDAAPDSPSPNLMGRWIDESRKHLRPMLMRSFMPVAATLLIAGMLGAFNLWVASRAAGIDAHLATLDDEQAEHRRLKLQMLATDEKLKRLKTLGDRLPRTNLTGVIEAVARCSPDTLWAERLTINDGSRARISGASYQESPVYDFVGYLNEAPLFERVALESTQLGQSRDGSTTDFQLNFVLATPSTDPPPETPLNAKT